MQHLPCRSLLAGLRTGSNPIDLLTFQVSASLWPYGSISVDLGLLALFLSMSVIEGWLALQFSPLVYGVQQDDLSDGSSLELMSGDFPLTYHGDQIGFY